MLCVCGEWKLCVGGIVCLVFFWCVGILCVGVLVFGLSFLGCVWAVFWFLDIGELSSLASVGGLLLRLTVDNGKLCCCVWLVVD